MLQRNQGPTHRFLSRFRAWAFRVLACRDYLSDVTYVSIVSIGVIAAWRGSFPLADVEMGSCPGIPVGISGCCFCVFPFADVEIDTCPGTPVGISGCRLAFSIC